MSSPGSRAGTVGWPMANPSSAATPGPASLGRLGGGGAPEGTQAHIVTIGLQRLVHQAATLGALAIIATRAACIRQAHHRGGQALRSFLHRGIQQLLRVQMCVHTVTSLHPVYRTCVLVSSP